MYWSFEQKQIITSSQSLWTKNIHKKTIFSNKRSRHYYYKTKILLKKTEKYTNYIKFMIKIHYTQPDEEARVLRII